MDNTENLSWSLGFKLPPCTKPTRKPLTCHIDNSLVLEGVRGEPRIGRPTRNLSAVVLRHHFERENARGQIAVLPTGCRRHVAHTPNRLPVQQPLNLGWRIRAPGVAPQRH